MHIKNKENDWMSIRDDDIWNTPLSKRKILPVLKLSYNYLPSHLKQCFSYCSIYPKNWEINVESLVHLWMAEGFLKQSNLKNKRSIEDLGRDYFESLAWSSFFQNFKKNELGDIETFKMHDLVHDLAQDVLGENEVVSFKASELKDVSEVRRLQLDLDEDITTFLESLSDAKKLRTIFLHGDSNLVNPLIFSENNHLRVLHVDHGLPDYSARPKWGSLSVKLKHLRYLRLTRLDLIEVENDQPISALYNLETLALNNMGVGVQNLLSNIQSSKKLRYLEVSWTDLLELPDSITCLCNLQTLDLNHCCLKLIPDSISGLKNLRFLNLSHNSIEELPVSITTLSNLQTLDVNTCSNLKALPEYVADLANLRIFDFQNCPLLQALPEDFGALTQLRSLSIIGTGIKVLPASCANLNNLESVSVLNCELPKDLKNWTKLRKLRHGLKGSAPISGVGKLVFLERLIYHVPEQLTDEPECNAGIEELGNLHFLEDLAIVNLQNVKDPRDAERANLKGKQNLGGLYLHWVWREIEDGLGWVQEWCNDLQVFDALQPPTSLRELGICQFMGWEFPTWMCVPSDALQNLVRLSLHNCLGFQQLPPIIKQLQRLKRVDLMGLSLESIDIGEFPSVMYLELTNMIFLQELSNSYPPNCLHHLRITGCKGITEIPFLPSLTILALENIDHKLVCSVATHMTSLTVLFLENVDELKHFPTSLLQNNSNLQDVFIRNCNQLEGFGVNDVDEKKNVVAQNNCNLHNSSLKELKFIDCPVLKFLPDLRGWTSLQKLIIFGCPQVKESLTYDPKDLSFLKELYVDFFQ